MEDTLNNSNDLFLSFRKEMEDMSKKGKRLEKENENFKRQKEVTRVNILNMAEERQDWMKKAESAEKKTEKLMSIIQQMQQQGRKIPPNMVKTLESYNAKTEQGAKADDSDYSEDIGDGEVEEGEDFEDDEGDDEDDEDDEDLTEEEIQPAETKLKAKETRPVTYGPERPPLPPPQPTINGH